MIELEDGIPTDVNPAVVDPAYEGEKVRLHVTELSTPDAAVTDPVFQLTCPNALYVKSSYEDDNPRVFYNALKEVRVGTYWADVRAGAYRLDFANALPIAPTHIADPQSATLPAVLQPLVKEITPTHILLRTDDFSNLALPEVRLQFAYAPSPAKVNFWVVGRQQGGCVHVETIECEESDSGMLWLLPICLSGALLAALLSFLSGFSFRPWVVVISAFVLQLMVAGGLFGFLSVLFH